MHRESMCVCKFLPYKLFCDGIFEVVMVSEWAAVIYTKHQEKHGAADKQIPGGQEKEDTLRQFGLVHKLVQTD